MRIEFLIVCNQNEATKEYLLDLVNDALEGTDDEGTPVEVIISLVRPTMGAYAENNVRAICGFEVIFTDILEQPHEVFTTVIDALKEIKDVHVLKFYDDVLLENNLQYYRELFEVEMRLRKVLSLIYLVVCDDRFYELLRDDDVKIISKPPPTAEEMRELSENEFFHLVFSQYININQRRKATKVDDVLAMVIDAMSFDEFRYEISRSPIENEKDKDFLLSLKAMLDPVESLRNSIAHNRTPSTKTRQSYQKAQEGLLKVLDNFLNDFRP